MNLLASYSLVLFLLQQIIGSYSDTQVLISGVDDALTIESYGEQRSIISDDDAKKWKIDPDYNCKSAVNQYFGKTPNDCYLHEPTPWSLYPTYGWQEVTSIYKPLSSSFIEKTSNPVALITRSYTNNNDIPITVTLSLKQSVTDTVTHKKEYGNEFGVSGSASFSIKVVDADVDMSYQHTWGTEETHEKTKTVSITDTVTAQIPPHTSWNFTMSSFNVKAKFEVLCSTYLEGYVTANYNPTYKDHHFWGLSASSVTPSQSPKQMTESITFDFYSNATLSATKLDLKNHTAVPMSVPLSEVLSPLVLYAD